ncbi:MAG: HEAT repeat domain-containing protein, partial [Longimicrobiales bacterium]
MILRHGRSLSLLCFAALTAACARPIVLTPEPAGERRLVQLDEAGIAALAALLRMEDSRVLDTALVPTQLAAPVAEVRARAALAAVRIGDRAALPLILRALADADDGVRRRAAFALGELGDSTAAVAAALSAVALRDAPG